MQKHTQSPGHPQDVTQPHPEPDGRGPQTERRFATAGLRSLFPSTIVGYLCLDGDGLVAMANPTLLRWLGLGYESVIGRRRFSELLRRQDQVAFEGAFLTLHEQGRLRDFRADLAVPEGEPALPVRVHLAAVHAEAGQFLRYDAVVIDNRELVDTERAIFMAGELLMPMAPPQEVQPAVGKHRQVRSASASRNASGHP